MGSLARYVGVRLLLVIPMVLILLTVVFLSNTMRHRPVAPRIVPEGSQSHVDVSWWLGVSGHGRCKFCK